MNYRNCEFFNQIKEKEEEKQKQKTNASNNQKLNQNFK